MAHSSVGDGLGDGLAALGLRHELDGVEDLHVAGTAAKVNVDRLRDVLPGRARVLVHQVLGTEENPGNTKSALQTRRGDEGAGEELALLLADSL